MSAESAPAPNNVWALRAYFGLRPPGGQLINSFFANARIEPVFSARLRQRRGSSFQTLNASADVAPQHSVVHVVEQITQNFSWADATIGKSAHAASCPNFEM
jgi:hypothetical protein